MIWTLVRFLALEEGAVLEREPHQAEYLDLTFSFQKSPYEIQAEQFIDGKIQVKDYIRQWFGLLWYLHRSSRRIFEL